jgi:CubicO group peptidase (beta-lactamase class C family)
VKRFFDGLNILLILAMLGFAFWAWPRLPGRVPVHFGIDGRPDSWTEKGTSSWFALPGVAVLLTLLMGAFRVLMRRYPHLVNLPDQSHLTDLPEAARGPVLEMLSGFLALVQTELLVIFGLIQIASFRSAMGEPSQGIMITVLILAVLTSPILLVVFFLRLQPALDRGKELARRKEAGVAGVCLLATLPLLSFLSACVPGEGGGPGRETDPGLRAADSLVAAAVSAGVVPGAVLRVARGDSVLLERAYGFSQVMALPPGLESIGGEADPYAEPPRPLAHPSPMTPGTAFDLASVTKVMATTMAVMLLVDRGDLELEAPVRAYLPEFRGEGKDSVTLRNLLTHSAGLAQWQPVYYAAETEQEAFRYVLALPLRWGVGEARHYSDLGFMVLGYVVERVTGEPLDVFLARELFEPLGLTRTGFRRVGCPDFCPTGPFAATSHGNPYEWRMVHDTAFGYRYSGDPDAWSGWRRHTLVGEVNDGNAFHAHQGVAGHAGLFSTAADLGRLLDLLLSGGTLDGHRILRQETVSLFLRPTEFGQALGWQTPSWAPEGSFSHTGFTGTFVLGLPSGNLGVVLLTNRQNLGTGPDTRYPELGDLQRGVVEALVGSRGTGRRDGSGR